MGKSRQGGVFGYLRGKVGSVSYSVQTAANSSDGKKTQVVRALPESVSNPQTIGQAMQRMKLAPAQKFYAAFASLLSNAFQGVGYGEESRRYFLSKCMKEEGPYVQRGVDRFIPAKYPFSEGSIPSVGIMPFRGGADVIVLEVTTDAEEVAPAILANALGVDTDYQITIAVVNNVNGVFKPSYISYDDRLKIADLPALALSKEEDGHITIDPARLGLDTSAMVACCVVLSVQDATGAWLRSSQNMVISNELEQSLYSSDALQAAIYSYQDATGSANAINSEWYYNLGMSQAFPGKLTTTNISVEVGEEMVTHTVILGLRQVNGVIKRTVFATSLENDGKVAEVVDGVVKTADSTLTVAQFRDLYPEGTVAMELWSDAYAAQLGF